MQKTYGEFFVDVLEDELFGSGPVDVDGDEAGLGATFDQLIALNNKFLQKLHQICQPC